MCTYISDLSMMISQELAGNISCVLPISVFFQSVCAKPGSSTICWILFEKSLRGFSWYLSFQRYRNQVWRPEALHSLSPMQVILYELLEKWNHHNDLSMAMKGCNFVVTCCNSFPWKILKERWRFPCLHPSVLFHGKKYLALAVEAAQLQRSSCWAPRIKGRSGLQWSARAPFEFWPGSPENPSSAVAWLWHALAKCG